MTGLFHLRIGAHIHVIPHSKGQIALLYLQLTLQKDGIFLPIWNFCAVSMFLQVMQHLSPQPLHCPISGLLVDMSALIKISFKLLGLKCVCYDGVIISDIC
jgi:hypothetical protein